MTFYKVRLELARTDAFPEGSVAHGYDLVVPLDAAGHLDEAAWRQNRKRCVIRRFWADEEDQRGELIHTRSKTWAFSYAPGEDDDEPLFRLDTHLFKQGDYISIREHEGETLPFRIVRVQPLD